MRQELEIESPNRDRDEVSRARAILRRDVEIETARSLAPVEDRVPSSLLSEEEREARRLRRSRGTKLQRAQKRLAAVHLRKAGHSYRSISKVLGISESAASLLVVEALRELDVLSTAEAQHVLPMELGRLDAWLERLGERIERGEPKAIEIALQIQARRLALLGAPVGRDSRGGANQGTAGSLEGGSPGSSPTGAHVLAFAEIRAGTAVLGAGAHGMDVEGLRRLVAEAIGQGVVRLPSASPSSAGAPILAEARHVLEAEALGDRMEPAIEGKAGGEAP